MPLTRDFKDLVVARMKRSPRYRQALLREGLEALYSGDLATGKRSCATTSTRRSAFSA